MLPLYSLKLSARYLYSICEFELKLIFEYFSQFVYIYFFSLNMKFVSFYVIISSNFYQFISK